MKLLMISGDRSLLQGKKGAFWYTLEEFCRHWERIDIICPCVRTGDRGQGAGERSVDSRSGPEGLQARVGGQWSVPFANVFFHPSPHGLWYQPWWILRKGKELIADHHHDVMTVHEYPPFYNGMGARRLHRATGIPYALEIHHIVGYPVSSSFAETVGHILSQIYFPYAVRKANVVRVVNAATKESLVCGGSPAEKITVVPSFYLDRETLRPESGIAKKYDVVASGRFVPNKGFPELLRAIALIPDVRLFLIGDGPQRSALERLARSLGIADRVAFAGWLPQQEDVMRAIQSAKVFVMPSKSEGGPRVALEAMAVGLPVVATHVGVMPEVITDGVNGVFTTGTPEDLAEKIQRLLGSDAGRARLGKEAEKILEKFERKRLIGEYAAFLQGLAGYKM